jgi:hypothetical protein
MEMKKALKNRIKPEKTTLYVAPDGNLRSDKLRLLKGADRGA